MKPYPYTEAAVTFSNPQAGMTLSGTLTLPPGKGPFPVLLLIAGSGPKDRDGFDGVHRPFLVRADYFTRQGVSVFRYDKRGVGASTGNSNNATLQDYYGDASAALEYLKSRKEINPKELGLLGHSEGAFIASMLAARSGDVSFVVLEGDSAIDPEQAELLQESLNSKAEGMDPASVSALVGLLKDVLDEVKEEKNDGEALKAIKAIVQKDTAAFKDLNLVKAIQEDMNSKSGMLISPMHRFFLGYDPKADLAKMKCPVLALYGDKDLLVPPEQNVPAIQTALKGNPDFTVKTFPGHNHYFQTCQTGDLAEYSKINETIDPAVLQCEWNWISKHLKN